MKSIPYGYKVEAYEPIDDRLVLTKAQMATAHEDMSLPDNYFSKTSVISTTFFL